MRARRLRPEVARRTGATLTGVDFSAEAVRLARDNAGRHGAAARFEIGRLDATGPDDAILCVDAIRARELSP